MAQKMVNCKACNATLSKAADKCPQCGHPNKAKRSGCLGMLGLLITGFIIMAVFLGSGVEKLANKNMQSITDTVATDMVAQYNIAKKQGDKMQVCVQAGMVSSAYLQAKDTANYNKWKATEKADCRKAGLPQ